MLTSGLPLMQLKFDPHEPPEARFDSDGTTAPATGAPAGGQSHPANDVSAPLIAVDPPIFTVPFVVIAPRIFTCGISRRTIIPARLRAPVCGPLPERPSDVSRNDRLLSFVMRTVSTPPSLSA